MSTKQIEGQMTFGDIEITATTPPPEIESPETTKTSESKINYARVPDSEFNMPKPTDVPTVKDIIKNLDKGTYKVSRHEILSDLFEWGAIAN